MINLYFQKLRGVNVMNKNAIFLSDLYKDFTERMVADPNMSIDGMRSLFDEWGKATLEPEDVTYKSDSIGGVEVVWANALHCDRSKILIFTHGGGFAVASSVSHRKLAGHISKALKVSVVVLDYRRSPENPYPAQIEDSVSVYKALLDSGIKAENIGTIGDSAGGNLAISSVLKFRELGLDLPKCVITFSPWLDMEIMGESLELNAKTDELISPPLLEGMREMYVGDDEDKFVDPLVNPLYANFTDFPPLYINAGGAEALLDDARRLYTRANASGVNTALSIVDGMQHVFPFLAGRAKEADEEIQNIAEWYSSL